MQTRHTAMGFVLALAVIAGTCFGPTQSTAETQITVAAAANLIDVFGEIGKAFENNSGVHVEFSFAATGDLTRQIENGAPFDVFAAADMEHIEQLKNEKLLTPGSARSYARGTLVLWLPHEVPGIRTLDHLVSNSVRFIAIAKPDIAPYGRAAVEALQARHIWDRVKPKIVYAENISMAKQYASTGNADAAFTAYSLVIKGKTGQTIVIDRGLYHPIDQGIGIVASSRKQTEAQRFVSFLTGPIGQGILARYGYQAP